MDAAERIADYLSDDLAPDEREAFEAELARDAALRAQLDAARRADDALASISPTALPPGFTERLRTAVDAELAEVLRPAATEAPDPRLAAQAELGQRDDLAARRAVRTVPRWVGGLAGAAAAVLVAVAGVAGLGSIGSGGDDATPESATGEAFDADGGSMGTFEAPAEESLEAAPEEETEEDAAGDTADDGEQEGEAADTMGDEDTASATLMNAPPVLVAEDRSLDDDQLDAVLVTPELVDLASRRLPAEQGETLAAEYAGRWRVAADDDTAARTTGAPTDADREAVAACLATDDGRGAGIPVYAEIAEYQGMPVIVLGRVTFDPASGTWSVPQVQVLDRTTCELLAARP